MFKSTNTFVDYYHIYIIFEYVWNIITILFCLKLFPEMFYSQSLRRYAHRRDLYGRSLTKFLNTILFVKTIVSVVLSQRVVGLIFFFRIRLRAHRLRLVHYYNNCIIIPQRLRVDRRQFTRASAKFQIMFNIIRLLLTLPIMTARKSDKKKKKITAKHE